MKTYILTIIILLGSTINLLSQSTYPCPTNGNAESGNFTNWGTYISVAQDPQNLNLFVPAFDPGRFGVHNSTSNFSGPTGATLLMNGVDNYGNFSIPSEGNYCFRVGNNASGSQADAMKYTFTVTNQNKILKLRYALVLQDGGHSAGSNPSAWFYCVQGTNITPSFSSVTLWQQTIRQFVADFNDPFYKHGLNGTVYRDWECLEFDLSAYVGQVVTFVAMVRDCTESGHFGYMYIDGLCTEWPATATATLNKNEYCLEEDIILDGADSEGEDSYFLEVAEVDPINNSYVSGGLEIQEWFIAQEVPNGINVSNFIASKGKKLECGKKYKVKVAVVNGCSQWNETNQYLNIVCPEINAGEDIEVCCSGEGTTQDYGFREAPVAGNTYSWTSIPSGFTASTSYIQVPEPNQSTAYLVEMTQPNGCIGRDTVFFRKISNTYTFNLTKKYELCDYAPYVTAHLSPAQCVPSQQFQDAFGSYDDASISWYFQPTNGSSTMIGTGKTIHAPNQDGTLTASITSITCPGVTGTGSVQIEYRPGGHGLLAPNSFTPDNGNYNNTFIIQEVGPDAPMNIGDEPAYGIKDFKLRIWNRWGENFKTITKADAGRLPNENVRQGDIFWDGTDQNGVVQDGTFNYSLEMQYCGQSIFTRVCLNDSEVNPCVRWAWIFCVERLAGGCYSYVNVLK